MSFAHRLALIPLKICNLSSAEKNLLIHLSAYADFKDGKNIRPTWDTIMNLTGFSRSHLSKLLKRLIEKNILLKSIDNSARYNPHMHNRKPCVYQLNLSLLDEWESKSSNTQTLEPISKENITSSHSELALVLPENQTSSHGEPYLCNTYSNTYCVGDAPHKLVSASKEKTAQKPARQAEEKFGLQDGRVNFDDFIEIAKKEKFKPSRLQSELDVFIYHYTIKSPTILTLPAWRKKMEFWCKGDQGRAKTTDSTKIYPMSEIQAPSMREVILNVPGYPNIKYMEKVEAFGGLDYCLEMGEFPSSDAGDEKIISNESEF